MKRIKPSNNAPQWPRQSVKSIECRKKDLIIRIADWTRDRYEPAFDVECYVGGVYDWNLSKTFTTKSSNLTKEQAKLQAIQFAQKRILELL